MFFGVWLMVGGVGVRGVFLVLFCVLFSGVEYCFGGGGIGS